MSDVSRFRETVAKSIMEQVDDPTQWLRALRRIAERLGLNPARCLPIWADVTLEFACFKVLQEADNQGRSTDAVWEALRNLGAR